MLLQLKIIYSDFTKVDAHDFESFDTVHKQFSVLNQRVIQVLEDNIANIDGRLSQIKEPTIKDEVIALVLDEVDSY